jgi:hypothetical protein
MTIPAANHSATRAVNPDSERKTQPIQMIHKIL